LRTLDYKPNKVIEDDLKKVKDYLPYSKDKMKIQYKELYHTLKTKNIFAD
jgi:hypothetical protein